MEGLILGIETSCDETAVAVIENGRKVLSSEVSTSEELHRKTGGIVPEVAAREQIRCMIPVLEMALEEAGLEGGWAGIGAVAVTVSPGLIGSLLVGVETAKTLSWVYDKPLVPVNHLLAHLYACWLDEGPEVALPIVGLIVSGGHTELVYMTDHGQYEWIGGTLDDAAGEAFDKGAKMLNLGYPGGPAIEKAAEEGDPTAFDFPRPMIDREGLDFSFSGLKTALFYFLKDQPSLLEDRRTVADLAASYQQAIVDVLVSKVLRAQSVYNTEGIILAGGVSANRSLRDQLKGKTTGPVYLSPRQYATDNAVGVAVCAHHNFQPQPIGKVTVCPNFDLR